jgi:phosphoenolpyruvate carboxykinase (GTP)
MPREGDIDLAGLDIPAADLEELQRVDVAAWKIELAGIENHFARFGNRLPQWLRKQLDGLRKR